MFRTRTLGDGKNTFFLQHVTWQNGWGGGWWGGPAYPYYLDYPNRVAHDRFRVEFHNGVISSISQENPPA